MAINLFNNLFKLSLPMVRVCLYEQVSQQSPLLGMTCIMTVPVKIVGVESEVVVKLVVGDVSRLVVKLVMKKLEVRLVVKDP